MGKKSKLSQGEKKFLCIKPINGKNFCSKTKINEEFKKKAATAKAGVCFEVSESISYNYHQAIIAMPRFVTKLHHFVTPTPLSL